MNKIMIIWLILPVSILAQGSATVSGRLTDEVRNGLPNGSILLISGAQPGSLKEVEALAKVQSYRAETDANGFYKFSAVAPGRYRLCANIGTFLDPCFWDAAPPEVSVSVGVSVVKDVIVQSGALVVVRVRDSKNLIDLTGKGGPFPLTAWVDDPKSRRSVTLLPRTRAGELIEFSGVVPRGGPTAVRVATTSGRLRLSGAPLGNTTSLEVTLTIPASPARVANRSLGIPLIGRKLGGESFVVPVDIE